MTDQPERSRIDEERPTPEQMIARIKKDERGGERGTLRVFLGAAPGAGKTYAMLEEGNRLREAGRDVVIGFVETYGRAETAAQIGDLETIPRVKIPYRGVVLEEMDTAAILARRPEIALVDELAHTNAPGSLHAKRYQDVEYLLTAGISVLSTMNVQHLEGLNDLVESVTGVKVRETVPDRILDEADVVMVDLPPPLLRERMEEGKIYPQQQIAQALENFFRESNLTALRELALRRTAEGVEAMLEGMMLSDQSPSNYPTIERVLVCIDLNTDAERVMRHAWRLARGLHAELLMAMVTGRAIEQLPSSERSVLERHIQLAEDLGAHVITAIDQDFASAIRRLAREHHVTDVVIGQPRLSKLGIRFGYPTLDRLVQELAGVDLHIVTARNR